MTDTLVEPAGDLPVLVVESRGDGDRSGNRAHFTVAEVLQSPFS